MKATFIIKHMIIIELSAYCGRTAFKKLIGAIGRTFFQMGMMTSAQLICPIWILKMDV